MRPAEFYRGREQSYLKHFVLENYLERLAFNVYSFANEIVYVDGFSGPWRSADDDHSDTSFYIASQKLKEIAGATGRRARAIFIEQDTSRFERLKKVAQDGPVRADVLNGSFEDLVPQLADKVGGSFAFYFVDPTGWKGLALKKLRPLVANRNAELLINFMYDYVNRFLEHPPVGESISDLFGGPAEGIRTGTEREESIVSLYRRRLKSQGLRVLSTSTRIRKPLESRAYFHLVYVTHHVKGLVEFKTVVQKLAPEELDTWAKVQSARDEEKGQQHLFGTLSEPATGAAAERPLAMKVRVDEICDELVRDGLEHFRTWADLQELLLQHPDVWNCDVKEATHRALKKGIIEIPELTGKRTRLDSKYTIRSPSKGC